MVTREYIPERGDLIWMDFVPQAGREQSGRRPALVLSPRSYNERAGLVVLCPVTSKVKGYPFEVALPNGLEVSGVVLSDHVKNLDWRVRKAVRIARAPASVVLQVTSRLKQLLE